MTTTRFGCAHELTVDQIQLATLVPNGDYADGNSVSVDLTAGLGANVKNAYFLKFISAATGGTVINFSDRFTLPSMSGTFPATVLQGLQTVSGTAGPATQNDIQAAQAGAGAGAAGDSAPAAGAAEYNVPYTLQTAAIRYAPMPPTAQTKITAKNASPQWPTSAYTVYKGIAGSPNAATTHTAQQTFSVSSREATVRCSLWDLVQNIMLTRLGCRGWPTNRHCDAKVFEQVERLIVGSGVVQQGRPCIDAASNMHKMDSGMEFWVCSSYISCPNRRIAVNASSAIAEMIKSSTMKTDVTGIFHQMVSCP